MSETPKSWLTVAECAADVDVAPEVVRAWCVRYDAGKSGGLANSHFGELPPDDPTVQRMSRRIRAEDWEAFKASRDRHRRLEERAADRAIHRALRPGAVDFVSIRRERARSVTASKRASGILS